MASDYDRIRKDNLLEYGQGTRHLEFFQRLYADKTHFILELLQNAEDAGATSVRFDLYCDRLELRHDGRPFDERDVRGVCGVGEGTKADDLTQIGKFGIGFKSVYAFTSRPEIHSGQEHFRIEHYVRPSAARPVKPGKKWTTLFVLPFVEPGRAFDEVASRLKGLGRQTLLFLHQISRIEWSVEGGASGSYVREAMTCNQGRRVRLVERLFGEQEQRDEWLVFERPVPVPERDEFVRVEAAFNLTRDSEGKEAIVRIGESPLVVFFPTEKATRLGFLIQGAYRTTPARDNVPREDAWNRRLIDETASLVAEALPILRDMGLLTVELLEAMPIRRPEDAMFRPIFDRVRETLREERLLPAHDGDFVAAKHAKLARGTDMRELLSDQQIRQLFAAEAELKWLSDDITQEKTPELQGYVVKELNVDEITPDAFARRFTVEFIEGQDDEWLVRFYGFLDERRALWRGGPLRNKPFVRLEDGQHVAPFAEDGSPNAYLPSEDQTNYPVVRRSIAEDEGARQFLKNLGLAEPDMVDEVIDRILPRYEQGSADSVSDEQHAADLHKIFSALKTDSHAKRHRLLERLKCIPFVRTTNAATGETRFAEPGRAYVRTPELEMYFAGNSQAWFVTEPGNDHVETHADWLGIGVEDKPRRIEIRDRLSWQEKWALRASAGHSYDVNDVDYDLDGLAPFLTRFSEDRESDTKAMATTLWNFLRSHLQESSRWAFFWGQYCWFYYKGRSASFDATLLKRLQASAWLPAAGRLCRPAEVSLADLPDEFDRDEELASGLGMKSDGLDALARQSGVAIEVLQHFKDNPAEWEAYKKWRAQQPQFPVKDSPNPEVRQLRVAEQAKQARRKQYDDRTRSVRTSDEIQPEAKTYLRELYANNDGRMICQACRKEMPFKLDDGRYYFEAVECVNDEEKELRENHLALCPTCAAKYRHANGSSPAQIRESVSLATGLEVQITLAREPQTLRFVEMHLQDLQVVLQGGGARPGKG